MSMANGKTKESRKDLLEPNGAAGQVKPPVFGILCRGGKVWAQVEPDVEAKTLLPLISRRVKEGSVVLF